MMVAVEKVQGKMILRNKQIGNQPIIESRNMENLSKIILRLGINGLINRNGEIRTDGFE